MAAVNAASDEYLVMAKTNPQQAIKSKPTGHARVIIAPKAVATPFPPLKLKKIG